MSIITTKDLYDAWDKCEAACGYEHARMQVRYLTGYDPKGFDPYRYMKSDVDLRPVPVEQRQAVINALIDSIPK